MVQVSNEWPDAVQPIAARMGGLQEITVERPGCGHKVTLQAIMQNGAIDAEQAKILQAELAKPCEECAALVQQSKK